MKYTFFLYMALVVMLFTNVFVYAEQHREIPSGATMANVLELWGHPNEKVVKEVKRESVWYYPDDGRVVFRDGVVKKWSYPTKYRNLLVDRNTSPTASPELDKEAESLVRDMAEAVRGAGNVSDLDPPRTGLVDKKPPLIRSRNSRNPRGVPIGDDEDDIDDNEEELDEEGLVEE